MDPGPHVCTLGKWARSPGHDHYRAFAAAGAGIVDPLERVRFRVVVGMRR